MKTDNGLWKFSPSGLYSFIDCKACFWIEQHYGRKPSIPLRLNDAVDEKLKARFDYFRNLKTLPPEILEKLPGYKLFPDQEQLDDWRNWRKGLEYINKKAGYALSGALDEIMIDPKGNWVPTDYKSSGDPPKEDKQKYYRLQLNAYGLILESLRHTIADVAYLLHYYPKMRNSRSLEMSLISHVDKVELNLADFKKTLGEMVKFLESKFPGYNEECKTCSWLKKIK